MSITLTNFADGTLCQGCSWNVQSVPELAARIGLVAIGQSRHVAKILAGINVAPPPTTASARIAAVKLLTVPSGADPFLIAEASADAAEVAKQITPNQTDVIEARLLTGIQALATGRLTEILSGALPPTHYLLENEPGIAATRALYFLLLKGVRALAQQMLGATSDLESPEVIFRQVLKLSVEKLDGVLSGGDEAPYSILPGPRHLASLLLAVARDLPPSGFRSSSPHSYEVISKSIGTGEPSHY